MPCAPYIKNSHNKDVKVKLDEWKYVKGVFSIFKIDHSSHSEVYTVENQHTLLLFHLPRFHSQQGAVDPVHQFVDVPSRPQNFILPNGGNHGISKIFMPKFI